MKERDFKEFVGRWQDEVRGVWEGLPPEKRSEMEKVLDLLPDDLKGWRGLMEQAVGQLRVAAGVKQQVAIVGPANTGKSTLYNALIRSKDDKAEVSAVPGTTRHAQRADAGLFAVIDTPGADAVGAVGEAEKERALAEASAADVLVILFDATHGIRPPEQRLFTELMALEKPTVVALNKMDLVRRERAKVIGKSASALGLSSEQLIPICAKKGQGVDRLLLAIAKCEPEIIAALGAGLPHYRWDLSQTVIARASSTAAAIAVTPLPFFDFFPLTGVQIAMVLGLARIYAYKITLERARELVATFGVAVIGRTLFHELTKLGGPPGWIVAAGVAAGTTAALGYAAAAWFDRGEKLSSDALKKTSQMVTQAILERFKGLGRRKPKHKDLHTRVRHVIQEMSGPDKEAVEEEEQG
jgi:small GTP-binding protein